MFDISVDRNAGLGSATRRDAGSRHRTSGAATMTAAPDWRTRFLAIITDPSVAMILMLVGVLKGAVMFMTDLARALLDLYRTYRNAREQEARTRDETDLEWLAAQWNLRA